MAKKPIVVDFHAHILQPHVLKMAAGRTVTTGLTSQLLIRHLGLHRLRDWIDPSHDTSPGCK